ncbi:hypothetical protein OV079_23695 [Nannocystis pusilla]|uniref:Uncharacterized protein n=1 Tax=Nannocystis pusilla TaxID=889268 RepID=A0A9X3EH65_9BACT|nr:hypothetical protein [Nannocystis pusilla]MCY1003979.1 hypothetical protein [Nannocystis pusilla]MCY1008506.1 hypothetical protein [Nannocystis pusilla]
MGWVFVQEFVVVFKLLAACLPGQVGTAAVNITATEPNKEGERFVEIVVVINAGPVLGDVVECLAEGLQDIGW